MYSQEQFGQSRRIDSEARARLLRVCRGVYTSAVIPEVTYQVVRCGESKFETKSYLEALGFLAVACRMDNRKLYKITIKS